MGFILSTNAGKQPVASITGIHLTREEKMVSQVQADMPTNSVSTSEHSNSAGPQEALQVIPPAGTGPIPSPRPPVCPPHPLLPLAASLPSTPLGMTQPH